MTAANVASLEPSKAEGSNSQQVHELHMNEFLWLVGDINVGAIVGAATPLTKDKISQATDIYSQGLIECTAESKLPGS